MGRRSRRRARERATKAAEVTRTTRSLPAGQRMARVNIGQVQWEEFLRTAASADRSVADYLGHLVGKELRRLARREGRTPTIHRGSQFVTAGADTQGEVI